VGWDVGHIRSGQIKRQGLQEDWAGSAFGAWHGMAQWRRRGRVLRFVVYLCDINETNIATLIHAHTKPELGWA